MDTGGAVRRGWYRARGGVTGFRTRTRADLPVGSGARRGPRWVRRWTRPCLEGGPGRRLFSASSILCSVARFSPKLAAFPRPAPFEPLEEGRERPGAAGCEMAAICS